MPNSDERDNQYGYGRTQPEFSLGERMATMEATLKALIDGTMERKVESKELFNEKLDGLRSEVGVKDKARQEAITKAETAANATASALATELRQARETYEARLGALERGGTGLAGEKLGAGDLLERERASRAERTAAKAIQVSVSVGVIAFIALVITLVKLAGG